MASPSTVISRGFGSWGGVHLLPTRGYGIGTPFTPPTTSRPFYRPQRIDVSASRLGRTETADSRIGKTDVADSRIGSSEDQVL